MSFVELVSVNVHTTPLQDLSFLEDAFEKNYDKELDDNSKTRIHVYNIPNIFHELFTHYRREQKQLGRGCSGAHIQRIISMYGLARFEKQHMDLLELLSGQQSLNPEKDLKMIRFSPPRIKYVPEISADGVLWLQTLDYISSRIKDLASDLHVSDSYLCIIILCIGLKHSHIPQNYKNELSTEINLFERYLQTLTL